MTRFCVIIHSARACKPMSTTVQTETWRKWCFIFTVKRFGPCRKSKLAYPCTATPTGSLTPFTPLNFSNPPAVFYLLGDLTQPHTCDCHSLLLLHRHKHECTFPTPSTLHLALTPTNLRLNKLFYSNETSSILSIISTVGICGKSLAV